MKNIIFLLSLCLLASCAQPVLPFKTKAPQTRNERKAQKKLRKAMRLDPNLVTSMYNDTTVHDTARAIVPIVTPGFNTETPGFDCDSLMQQLAKITDKNTGLYLYSDSLIDILVKRDKNGNMKVNANVKPRVNNVEVKIPYTKYLRIRATVVNKNVRAKAWSYGWFWILIGVTAVMTFVTIRVLGKSDKTVIFAPNDKDNDSATTS